MGKPWHREVERSQEGGEANFWLSATNVSSLYLTKVQIKASGSLEECAAAFSARIVVPQRSNSVHIIKKKYFMLMIPKCLLSIYLGS